MWLLSLLRGGRMYGRSGGRDLLREQMLIASARAAYENSRMVVQLHYSVIERLASYEELPAMAWRENIVSHEGIRLAREGKHLPWSAISGIGLQMAPQYEYTGQGGSVRILAGYSLLLLIVPRTGQTLELPLVPGELEPCAKFAGLIAAYTERLNLKYTVLGYDKEFPEAIKKVKGV